MNGKFLSNAFSLINDNLLKKITPLPSFGYVNKIQDTCAVEACTQLFQ